MATGPGSLVFCAECGASNYATSAKCWMCHAALPAQPPAKSPAVDFNEPILAEVVYPHATASPRQGSSVLAITLSTLAVGLGTALLGGVGLGMQAFTGSGNWDDGWMMGLFVAYVVLGGLLATAASLAVTPPKTGWNPAASFAARFTISSLLLVVLFPIFVVVIVISAVIALFITCLSGRPL